MDGQLRPVELVWSERAAAQSAPALIIDFHIESSTYAATRQDWAGSTAVYDEPLDGPVVVRPLAQAGPTPVWFETDGFNLRYVDELMAMIERNVCFDPSRVVLIGSGQGTAVVAQIVCFTTIPVALAIGGFGGPGVPPGCSPSRPVPLISHDVYEFDITVGPSWDEAWDSSYPIELREMGRTPSAVDRFARWADLYACDGAATRETIGGPEGTIERATTLLSNTDCDAPLYWFGYELAEPPAIGADPSAFLAALPTHIRLHAQFAGP